MTICACGCGEQIEPQPHHKYQPARFKPNHFQRAGLGRVGKRHSARRIPTGTLCACGCGTALAEFQANGAPRYANTEDGRFYQRGHHMPARTGELASQWKGGRSLSSAGYVVLRMPGHRLADRRGNVREHRLVWEEANGRHLQAGEDVHHINGIKDDNRPENLVALTRHEHGKLHGKGNSARGTA